jgi:hypothetical protein
MEKGSSVHMAGVEAHKQNNVSNPEVAKNGSSSRQSQSAPSQESCFTIPSARAAFSALVKA